MHQWSMACRILISAGLLSLNACNTGNHIESAKVVYPDLPNVPPLADIDLKPIVFNWPSTDMFIALDYTNYTNLQINLQTLKQREILYRQRIDEVNNQREEWRQYNKKED